MPYSEGVANSFADLLAAVRNACTASGWTLDGSVLHAGRCYVRHQVVGSTIQMEGGTGVSGNTLLEPAPAVVRIGSAGAMPFSFPCTYRVLVFSAPAEVYLLVNYEIDRWQWLAFGESSVDSPGSGCWVTASMQQANPTTIGLGPTAGYSGAGRCSCAPFWSSSGTGQHSNSFIHSDVDGRGWVSVGANFSLYDVVSASDPLIGLIDRLPSAFNANVVLLPGQVWQSRQGDTSSLVADLANCRFLRIDNYIPAEVVEVGGEQWMVVPFYLKNTAQRDGGQGAGHSGTMGMAIRYDGP